MRNWKTSSDTIQCSWNLQGCHNVVLLLYPGGYWYCSRRYRWKSNGRHEAGEEQKRKGTAIYGWRVRKRSCHNPTKRRQETRTYRNQGTVHWHYRYPPLYIWGTRRMLILWRTEMFFDRGNHYEFLSLGQELAAPGDLQHPQTFDFNFKNVEKQYESYNGINVRLRYFVRVTVSRRMADVIREKDIWVYSYRIPPETNSSIKMDVGIEDCLHIEFEYSKSRYHLKDVIVGRIYFLLVRLKIKHMELSIIRRETTGVAPNQYNESETLVRFEVRDLVKLLEKGLINGRLWMGHPREVYYRQFLLYRDQSTVQFLNYWCYYSRRDYSNSIVSRRIWPYSDFPWSQQEILYAILSKFGSHRWR